MFKLFSNRRQKTVKDTKLSKYDLKKIEIMRHAAQKLNDFTSDHTFVNTGSNEVIFIDESKRQLGIYKAVMNKYLGTPNFQVEGQGYRLHFKDIESVCISFNGQSVEISSNYEFGLLAKDENMEEKMTLLKQKMTSVEPFTPLFLHIKERNDLNEHDINVTFYESTKVKVEYNEIIENIKQVFRLLVSCLLDGEKEFIEEQERLERESELKVIENRVEYLEHHALKGMNKKKPLLIDLICSWDYLKDEIHEVAEYKFNFDSLYLKGLRNNVLYISCTQEDYVKSQIPQLTKLITYVFKTYGFFNVEIVPEDQELEDVPMGNNLLLWDQVFLEMMSYAESSEIEHELKKAKIRTYQNGMLFIDYDGEEIEELKKWWDNSKWLPKALFALTGIDLQVFFVKSLDSIEQISLELLNELWKVVIENVRRKLWRNYDYEALEASKPHVVEDNTLHIYLPEQFTSSFSYELTSYILYDLFIHTGKRLNLEFIISPLEENNIQPLQEFVLEWIKDLEEKKEKHFKLMDLRDSNDCLIVLVDDKLYTYRIGDYTVPTSPHVFGLNKHSLRIFEAESPKRIFIEESPFDPNPEFEQGIKDYITLLDIDQQDERNKIREALNSSKLVDLIKRFYTKEIKNRFRPSELVEMFEWDYSFNENIYPISNLIKKKGYVLGKDYLVDDELRNAIKKIIISDISGEFMKQNYEAFKGITEMTLSRCLMVYRSLEFSNVENDDDVIIFTFFLLDYNKVLYDDSHYTSSSEPYNRLIQKVRNLINEVDEQDKLDEFEAYLYSDENSSNQTITIEMIDTMNGYEFESFIAELFTRMGYKVQITQSAGDYGIDVIARKKEVSIGIQAKCYSNKVPNKAIQEAIAGISFYNLNKGLVVTNNYFTKQAQNQAIRSNIMLWDRNILNEKLIEFFTTGTNA